MIKATYIWAHGCKVVWVLTRSMQLWDRKKVWFNQLSDYNETSPKYNSDMGIDPSHGCWHTSDSEPASETVYQVKSHNYIIIAVFCLLQFSLSRYSNSEIRLGFSWEFCIWRYIGQPICWRSNFSRAPEFCSILPFMVKPNEIFKFWHQIWNLLKIVLQMIPKPSNLVRVNCFAYYGLAWPDFQILLFDLDSLKHFIYSCKRNHSVWWYCLLGLAWSDIQILSSDLDSPRNFIYGSKRNHSVWWYCLLWSSLPCCSVIKSGFL